MKKMKRRIDSVMDHLENMSTSEEVALDNVFNRIDAWHESDSRITLAAYLGWSDEEYRTFVRTCKIPEREYE